MPRLGPKVQVAHVPSPAPAWSGKSLRDDAAVPMVVDVNSQGYRGPLDPQLYGFSIFNWPPVFPGGSPIMKHYQSVPSY